MSSHVLVTRGELVESRHLVHVAIARPDGSLVAHSGEADRVVFCRSAAKILQAIPAITAGAADALGLGDEELALACASHNGEPRHVGVAHRLLARSGAVVDDLVCGPHVSLSDDVARGLRERGETVTRAHNNCSGKHALMIALARHRGWGPDYAAPTHPVQRGCLEEVARWSGLAPGAVPLGTDGCGVPSFALPLQALARAYARLAAAVAGDGAGLPGDAEPAARRLVAAIRAHPFLIAGTGRLDTELIEASGGRVVPKVGAEGVYCAMIPDLRLGLALKVEDGATRALNPALLALLEETAPGLAPGLDHHRRPSLRNTTGADVGHLEARIELVRGARD